MKTPEEFAREIHDGCGGLIALELLERRFRAAWRQAHTDAYGGCSSECSSCRNPDDDCDCGYMEFVDALDENKLATARAEGEAAGFAKGIEAAAEAVLRADLLWAPEPTALRTHVADAIRALKETVT